LAASLLSWQERRPLKKTTHFQALRLHIGKKLTASFSSPDKKMNASRGCSSPTSSSTKRLNPMRSVHLNLVGQPAGVEVLYVNIPAAVKSFRSERISDYSH
jgi:hypothetical protein